MAAKKPAHPPTPEICPVCGEDVPKNALACPECGADHRSGWREDADEADLPDTDFNYESFVKEEFGNSWKPRGLKMIWWITAVILLLGMMMSYWFFGQ